MLTGTRAVALVVILAGTLFSLALGAEAYRVDDRQLAELEFSVPDSPQAMRYLGLTGKSKFRLSHIRAGVVLVEIFSMYCPICQDEAPNVNELYNLVQRDPSLKDRVKILGIGTGNTPFEVDVFRKKYEIPFPLVPDDDMVLKRASPDQIRTPTFVIVRIEGGNRITVQGVHVGRIGNVSEFIKTLSESSRKKEGAQ